jgi:predicted GNAT family acetyltransferase
MDSETDAERVHVVDNPSASRFEAAVDGELAVTEYERAGRVIIFTHTEVPPSIEGKGVASALARTALDLARAQGLAVVPRCPFISAYIKRHPEYESLVRRWP